MDRRDWLVAWLAGTIGVMGTLGGSWIAGYQHERTIARQVQIDIVKLQAIERITELKAFKEAGLRYMKSIDNFVNKLAFDTSHDKNLVEQLGLVQSSANDLVLTADDELTRQTMAVTQTMNRLLIPSEKPMEQRLAELNLQVVDWIKQYKRSLEAMKTQNEEMLNLPASVQATASLKH